MSDGLQVEPERRLASWRGKPLILRRREFDLLAYLYLNFGKLCTKKQLREALYGDRPLTAGSRAMEQTVKRLRQKLPPGMVQTQWGVGYWLDYQPVIKG